MDADTLKFVANFLAKKIAAWAAGSLVTVGALQPNQETQFITMGSGIIVGLLAFIWSWWNDRGKSAVLAKLAKAHGIVSQAASTATASKNLVAAVNDDSVVPVGAGAVKIASAILIGLFVLHAMPAMAQTSWSKAQKAINAALPIPLPAPKPAAALTSAAAVTTPEPTPEQVVKNLQALTQADAAYAIALAKQANTPASNVRLQETGQYACQQRAPPMLDRYCGCIACGSYRRD